MEEQLDRMMVNYQAKRDLIWKLEKRKQEALERNGRPKKVTDRENNRLYLDYMAGFLPKHLGLVWNHLEPIYDDDQFQGYELHGEWESWELKELIAWLDKDGRDIR